MHAQGRWDRPAGPPECQHVLTHSRFPQPTGCPSPVRGAGPAVVDNGSRHSPPSASQPPPASRDRHPRTPTTSLRFQAPPRDSSQVASSCGHSSSFPRAGRSNLPAGRPVKPCIDAGLLLLPGRNECGEENLGHGRVFSPFFSFTCDDVLRRSWS